MPRQVCEYRGYKIKSVKSGWKIYFGVTVINPTVVYPTVSDAKNWIDKRKGTASNRG